MHFDNENFIIFIIFFKAYKYRVLSFKLINNFIIY